MVIIDEGGVTAKRLGVAWNPGAITIEQRKIGEGAIVNTISQLASLIYDRTVTQDRRRMHDGVPA